MQPIVIMGGFIVGDLVGNVFIRGKKMMELIA
jgi:hypothetical protein